MFRIKKNLQKLNAQKFILNNLNILFQSIKNTKKYLFNKIIKWEINFINKIKIFIKIKRIKYKR